MEVSCVDLSLCSTNSHYLSIRQCACDNGVMHVDVVDMVTIECQADILTRVMTCLL